MASKIIFCRNCDVEKQEIEQSGAFEVISCESLPDQDDVPTNLKKCKIKWKPR
jgi:hypothetical protein